MERLVSDEERIRRAEDVIARRRNMEFRISGDNFSIDKDAKKVRKILIQIMLCLILYCGVFYLKNCPDNNSKNIIININNFLKQDINFNEVFSAIISKYNSITDKINNYNKTEESNSIDNNENLLKDNLDDPTNAIPIEENIEGNQNTTEQSENKDIEELGIGGSSELTDEDLESNTQISDSEYIKKNFNIINPLPSGVITSRFGVREANEIISANHKGIDIGAITGTDIVCCMDGEITETSSKGDFGVHLKITNNDIDVIYAHCSEIFVREGDRVVQGDVIAKVGATGKVTGPHLHFEIRRANKAINPDEILQF